MIHPSINIGGYTNPTSRIKKTSKSKLTLINTVGVKRSFGTKSQRENEDGSKRRIDREESNTGFPKSGNGYGDGGPIEGNQRMQLAAKVVQQKVSANINSESTGAGVESFAEKIRQQLMAGTKNVYRLLLTEELFVAAYHRIKSVGGNMTPGSDEERLEFSLVMIRKIIASLKDQSFKFRRVLIAKANGKMRQECPVDKIVLEAMRILVEQIFEPEFLETSHGFRPGKGCHSALKNISK